MQVRTHVDPSPVRHAVKAGGVAASQSPWAHLTETAFPLVPTHFTVPGTQQEVGECLLS